MYPKLGAAIHHERGGVFEEAPQHGIGFGGQTRLIERAKESAI